jgi:hypothetical protein
MPDKLGKAERKKLLKYLTSCKRWDTISQVLQENAISPKLVLGVDPVLVIRHGPLQAMDKSQPQGSSDSESPSEEAHGELESLPKEDLYDSLILGLKAKHVVVPIIIGSVSYMLYLKTRPSTDSPSKLESIFFPLYSGDVSAYPRSTKLDNVVGNNNQYSKINWSDLPSEEDLDAVCQRYISYANGDDQKIAHVRKWKDLVQKQYESNNDGWNRIQGHRDAQKEFDELLSKNGF